jgi:putative ABC transport system permease protein
MENRDHKLSRFARWILEKLSVYSQRYLIKEDLEEEYLNLCQTQGKRKARRWLRRQTLLAVGFYLKYLFSWRNLMLKNYLKITIRNIKRHKGYSFINISGLAVGMAVFILISLFVQYELSFDRYHENADRIYRVTRERENSAGNDRSAFIPNDLGPAMVEEFPEVISAARLFRWHRGENYFSFGDTGIYEKLYYIDPQFFEIFSIPFISGNPKAALNDPLSLVLSARLAEKHFRNEDPVGKQLMLREGDREFIYKITGVFENMPDNSHLIMDLITPIGPILQETGDSHTYVLLEESANPNNVEKKLSELVNRQFSSVIDDRTRERYFLQPLTAIHLHSRIGDNTVYSNYNDIRNIYIYVSVAILILIIVCLNYMNLTAARSFQRYKEIGIRKVVGANRKQLFIQFLGESFLITVFSLIGSMILAVLFLPGYNSIIGGNLSLAQMQKPTFFLAIAAVVFFVGVLGGCYPAFYLSSLRSVNILKGITKKKAKRSWVRDTLVVSQFSIAIIIISSTFVISSQLHFINTKDMGYDREQIVVLSHLNNHMEVRRNEETIKTELLRNPNITAVSCSSDLPNHSFPRGQVELQAKSTGEPVPFNVYTVDHDFLDLYGIEIVEGRTFFREFPSGSVREVLINQTAAKALGEESPIGKEFRFWGSRIGRIVGVLKDFHSLSLHHQIPPTFIAHYPAFTNHISIKINIVNIPETISAIEKTMNKLAPHYPFDYHFFDEIFERDYQSERKMEKIFRFFMLLSIGLACMGLFGISTYSAQLRIKEIGIRKVLGASVSGITLLLSQDFTKCVLFANIFAWPVAYYLMNKWLQNFTYRIGLSVWIFLISGLAALCIALLTVSFHSIKAATANPVESLRYE